MKKKNDAKSPIWKFFQIEKSNQYGKCKECNQIIKYVNGSSVGLQRHLQRKHKESYKKFEEAKKNIKKVNESQEVEADPILSNELTELILINGMSILALAKSKRLKESYKTLNWPENSSEFVKNLLIRCEELKTNTKAEIKSLKDSGEKFSVSCKDYKSSKNITLSKVFVTSRDKGFNLGMVPIFNVSDDVEYKQEIQKKLEEYSINLNEDTICCTTNNFVIQNNEGIDTPFFQSCLGYAYHKSVSEFLYEKKEYFGLDNNEDDFEEKMKAANECYGVENSEDFEIDISEKDGCREIEDGNVTNYSKSFKPILSKIKNLFKEIQVSSKKQKELEFYSNENFDGKLIIENGLSWLSVLNMVSNFLKLEEPLQKIKTSYNFSTTEIETLKDLEKTLKAIKGAVLEVCKKGTNLFNAEVAHEFLLEELKRLDTEISKTFYNIFLKEIKDARNTQIMHLYAFLKVPGFADKDHDYFGIPIKFSQIKKTAMRVLSIAGEENVVQNKEDEKDKEELEDTSKPFGPRLKRNIENQNKRMDKRIRLATPVSESLNSELDIFKANRQSSENLKLIEKRLKTIRASSVEESRVFKSPGFFISKIKSHLRDDVINALFVIKDHI